MLNFPFCESVLLQSLQMFSVRVLSVKHKWCNAVQRRMVSAPAVIACLQRDFHWFTWTQVQHQSQCLRAVDLGPKAGMKRMVWSDDWKSSAAIGQTNFLENQWKPDKLTAAQLCWQKHTCSECCYPVQFSPPPLQINKINNNTRIALMLIQLTFKCKVAGKKRSNYHTKYIVHDLINLCSNHTMFKPRWIRIYKTQFSVCFRHTCNLETKSRSSNLVWNGRSQARL